VSVDYQQNDQVATKALLLSHQQSPYQEDRGIVVSMVVIPYRFRAGFQYPEVVRDASSR
jgi:hypothetical protein